MNETGLGYLAGHNVGFVSKNKINDDPYDLLIIRESNLLRSSGVVSGWADWRWAGRCLPVLVGKEK